jgi:hypothetical protein
MITYLRRSLKYFIQITFIFAVAIGILMLTGLASKDIDTAFRHGWQSVEYILIAFAVMSLFYPLFGYSQRQIHAQGDPADHWKAIDQTMDLRGYEPAGETPEGARKYHLRSFGNRMARLWEDTITINPVLGGFQAEGLTRDLVRVVMALDRKLNNYDN